jgi:hypothetical protein
MAASDFADGLDGLADGGLSRQSAHEQLLKPHADGLK